jgi:hypothetical protein
MATRVFERPARRRVTPLVVALCAAVLVLLLGGALILLARSARPEPTNEGPVPDDATEAPALKRALAKEPGDALAA